MTLVTSEPQKDRREIIATLYYLSMSLLKGKLYLKAEIPKDASIQHMVFFCARPVAVHFARVGWGEASISSITPWER